MVLNQCADTMAGWQAGRLAGLAVATGKARNGTLLKFSLGPVIHTKRYIIESCMYG